MRISKYILTRIPLLFFTIIAAASSFFLILNDFPAADKKIYSSAELAEMYESAFFKGDLKKQLKYLREAFLQESSDSIKIELCLKKADILIQMSEYKTAAAELNQCRQDVYKYNQSAMYYLVKGRLNYALADFVKAEQHLTEGLEHACSISPNIAAELFISLSGVCFSKGLYQQGLQYADSANKLIDKDQQSLLYSSVLNTRGKNYFVKRDYDSAYSCFNEALEIREKIFGKVHPLTAEIIHNIGSITTELGNFSMAEEYLTDALEVRSRMLGEDHPLTADTYNNLGTLYNALGEDEKAISYYLKALHIRENKFEASHSAVLVSYNNSGNAYLGIKDYNNALQSFRKAIELKQLKGRVEDLESAYLYNNIGTVLKELKKPDEALKYFNKSLTVLKKVFGRSHLWLAYTNLNRGVVFRDLKEYDKSLASFNEVFINMEGINEVHPLKAGLYTELARLYYELEEHEKSLNNIKKGLRISAPGLEEEGEDKFLFYQEALNLLTLKASLLYDKYLRNKNTVLLEEAYSTQHNISDLIDLMRKRFSTEKAKLWLGKDAKDIYEKGIETASELYNNTGDNKYYEFAFTLSEKSKSLSLLENLAEIEAKDVAVIPDSLLKLEAHLKREIYITEKQLEERITTGVSSDSPIVRELRGTLLNLNIKYEELIKRFEVNYPEYHSIKYSSRIISVEDVKKKLIKEGTAVLEYFAGRKNLYLFIISNKEKGLIKLPADESIYKMIATLKEDILSFNYQQYTRKAEFLYKYLFAHAEMDGVGTYIIIPDGALSYLPFEVLITAPASGRMDYKNLEYLIKKYRISYGYSCTLLNQNIKKREPAEKIFIGFAPE
jgi:tetratricopeptide (TPR) repeat protein